MSNERAGQSLQPAALVNETYPQLFGINPTHGEAPGRRLENRRNFFGAAAEAIRPRANVVVLVPVASAD
ncbi:MAG: hypothetical protein KDA99_04300 [Planctomycetales bacterium]|nr:hypothetical protein [Planctomycetales bacterium]